MSHAGLVEAHCATCGKWTGWTSPNRPATAEPIQCHGCIAKRQAERIFGEPAKKERKPPNLSGRPVGSR